jgi:hypothetical protein
MLKLFENNWNLNSVLRKNEKKVHEWNFTHVLCALGGNDPYCFVDGNEPCFAFCGNW